MPLRFKFVGTEHENGKYNQKTGIVLQNFLIPGIDFLIPGNLDFFNSNQYFFLITGWFFFSVGEKLKMVGDAVSDRELVTYFTCNCDYRDIFHLQL